MFCGATHGAAPRIACFDSVGPNIESLPLALRVAQDQHASAEVPLRSILGDPVRGRYRTRRRITPMPWHADQTAQRHRPREVGGNADLHRPRPGWRSGELQRRVARDGRRAPWTASFLRGFESKGLLSGGDHRHAWIHRVCTQAIADWACATVETLAANAVGLAPAESAFRQRLQSGTLERGRGVGR